MSTKAEANLALAALDTVPASVAEVRSYIAKLEAALAKCCVVIEHEVSHGDDHPVVRAHGRVAKRARALLDNKKSDT